MTVPAQDYDQQTFESRRDERKGVRLSAMVRRDSTMRFPVDILDLSVSGFRFHAGANLTVGTRVWLTIPGMQGLEATISWERKGDFGCQFDRLLHPAVLDHIVRNCS